MPENFSFGLEERSEETSDAAASEAIPESLSEAEAGSSAECQHKWAKLPEEQQTLDSESKIVWMCQSCGQITNTYAWKKP